MPAYYNDIDPHAVHVLRCLIADGLIAPGDVDSRSIAEVQPDDIRGYAQVHLFAGAGLWSVALRLAGWPDSRPAWSASCPCQPFSAAGKGLGLDDPRHLWPHVNRLVRGARAGGSGPDIIVGEQVAGSAGYGWFNGVRADLEAQGYGAGVVDIPSLAVDAPHIRQRLYWCGVVNAAGERRGEGRAEHDIRRGRATTASADAPGLLVMSYCEYWGSCQHVDRCESYANACDTYKTRDEWDETADERFALGDAERAGLERQCRNVSDRDGPGRFDAPAARSAPKTDGGDMAVAPSRGWSERQPWAEASRHGREPAAAHGRNGSFWADHEWIECHDGKARRTKPGLRLLVDGMAGRIPAWRLAGNSINPVLAAEVIGALMEAQFEREIQPWD